MKNIYKKFKKVLQEVFFVNPKKISPELSFSKGLRFNSLEFNELLANVEYQFHVEIPDEDIKYIDSVGDMVSYLEKKALPA